MVTVIDQVLDVGYVLLPAYDSFETGEIIASRLG
jgi:hypothetical protein